MENQGEVTLLLQRIAAGDRSAEEALLPRVYQELHRLALARLSSERAGHTLQATALVNEAYLRLFEQTDVAWQGRAHFFRLAARIMRNILTDYGRQRNAGKRGQGLRPASLDEVVAISDDNLELALQVDELLTQLGAVNQRQARVVELKFFGGMTDADIASVLAIGVRTVKRDWFMARAWMHAEISGDRDERAE